MVFQFRDGVVPVMHDGRDERGRGPAFSHGLDHMLRAARASQSDDRHAHMIGDEPGQSQFSDYTVKGYAELKIDNAVKLFKFYAALRCFIA